MLVMYAGWKLLKQTRVVTLRDMDLDTDTYPAESFTPDFEDRTWKQRIYNIWRWIL